MAKVTMNDMVFEGTPEEIAAVFAEMEKRQGTSEIAEPAPKEDSLKVGDYAKITNVDKLTLAGFKVGDIVELHRNRYGEFDEDYYVKTIDDSKAGYAPKIGGYVEKLTEDEVALIKEEIETKETQRKLELKWADLGRKVNEFKSGDIVLSGGTLEEVNEFKPTHRKSTHLPFKNHEEGITLGKREYWTQFKYVKLVTPVEARFDR